jgi:hypothetical protein
MEFVIFHSVMDKSINRHLLRKGVVWAKRTDEPMSFSERASDFFRWFNESVMHFDSDEYRQEFWREAYRHGHTIGKVPYTLNDHFRRKNARSEIILANMLAIGLLMGGAFAIWVIRRKIDQHIHRLRRPTYYESERNRRLGLTHERRRIHNRSTSNPCPTADELRNAFKHARDSVENMVRIGSLMEDLECYVDNSLIFGEHGQIIARKGGIRRYIQSEIPDLYDSYKTLMRYKALAKKFRQAVGINDPIPAASVLPDSKKSRTAVASLNKSSEKEEESKEIIHQNEKSPEIQSDENMVRTNSYECDDKVARDEVIKRVKEILDVCEGTFLNLSAVLAMQIGEYTIPHMIYQKTNSWPLEKRE